MYDERMLFNISLLRTKPSKLKILAINFMLLLLTLLS